MDSRRARPAGPREHDQGRRTARGRLVPETRHHFWQVVVDGKLYIRSVKGPEGAWYRGVVRHHEGFISWNGTVRAAVFTRDSRIDAAIDSAYLRKYGNGPSTRAINSATAKTTTLRVTPVH